MKLIRYRLYKTKEALQEKQAKYFLTNPMNIIFLLVLLIRSITLRLIPRITKMYFIRKDFSDYPIEINKTEYDFKIYSGYSEEINTFVLNRCAEDSRLILEIYRKSVMARLNRGFKANTLLHKKVIVSIFFTSYENCYVEQVNYTYKPDKSEILILDIYTLLNYRKQGLYSLLFRHSILDYRHDGINNIVMWIMKHNRATIKAQLKMGFTEIFRTVTLFSWFGLEKRFIGTSKKFLITL
jgi:hypothetical protein